MKKTLKSLEQIAYEADGHQRWEAQNVETKTHWHCVSDAVIGAFITRYRRIDSRGTPADYKTAQKRPSGA